MPNKKSYASLEIKELKRDRNTFIFISIVFLLFISIVFLFALVLATTQGVNLQHENEVLKGQIRNTDFVLKYTCSVNGYSFRIEQKVIFNNYSEYQNGLEFVNKYLDNCEVLK